MRIKCDHGYYRFYPDSFTDIQRLNSLYSVKLVSKNDYYTFPELTTLPSLFVKGQEILGFTVNTTCQGDYQYLLRTNRCVFDIKTKKLVAIDSITIEEQVYKAGLYMIIGNLIPQAGSLVSASRLTGFDGNIDQESARLRIREVTLE